MTSYDRFISHSARNLHESAIRKMGTLGIRIPDLVSFAAGFPDPATFPWPDLQAIAAELLTGSDASVLQYGATRGYRPLLEAIATLMKARGVACVSDELIVTTGSQQGLDLVSRVLIDPGDVVLMELPTYTGAISAFVNGGARPVGVRQEGDGVDLADLDAVLLRERAAGQRVRFLYVVPNFQNPTGLLIGLEKRRALLEWAARRDVLLIEDDPYGVLYFDDVASEPETRPIKADDADGRVIYMSTFSKTLAPGFRVAWIVAPPAVTEKFELAKQSMDLSSGIFDQRVVHQAVVRGVVDRLAPHLRRHYQQKRDVMEQALRAAFGDLLSWPAPKGGFFIWATLPAGLHCDRVLEDAMKQRVIFVAGNAFYVDGTGERQVRLSFSAPTPDRMREGVRRFAAAVQAQITTPAR